MRRLITKTCLGCGWRVYDVANVSGYDRITAGRHASWFFVGFRCSI